MSIDELNAFFDESIPEDVVQSDSWTSRLMPDPENLDMNKGHDDIVESEPYGIEGMTE